MFMIVVYIHSLSKLTALGNRYWLFGSPGILGYWRRLDLANNIKALLVNHLAEHNILAVQPLTFPTSNEELAAIPILPCTAHRQESRFIVIQQEIFVIEIFPVNAGRACSIVVENITAFQSHILGDLVKDAALVACRFAINKEFTRAHLSKVLCCTRSNISE